LKSIIRELILKSLERFELLLACSPSLSSSCSPADHWTLLVSFRSAVSHG